MLQPQPCPDPCFANIINNIIKISVGHLNACLKITEYFDSVYSQPSETSSFLVAVKRGGASYIDFCQGLVNRSPLSLRFKTRQSQ